MQKTIYIYLKEVNVSLVIQEKTTDIISIQTTLLGFIIQWI